MWSLSVWVDEWCDHFLCELTSDVITFCVSWRVIWSLSVWVDEWFDHFLCELTSDLITSCVSWRVIWSLSMWFDESCDHFLCEFTSNAITFCVSWRVMWSLSVWVTSKSVNWRQFIVRRWCKVVPLSVWVDEWPNSTLSKTRKSRLNAFWFLSVCLHGLGVHFCLGLHNVGKKKLFRLFTVLYFSVRSSRSSNFALRAAILHECQNHFRGRGRFGRKREK